MLFAGCIMCLAAGACLPSRKSSRVQRLSTTFLRLSSCLSCDWGPSSFSCGEMGSGNPIACSEPQSPMCKIEKAYSVVTRCRVRNSRLS